MAFAEHLHVVQWLRNRPKSEPALTPAQRLTLLVLADHMDKSKGYAWLAVGALATLVGVGVRQQRLIVGELEGLGLLTRSRRRRPNSSGNDTNSWEVRIDRMFLPTGFGGSEAFDGRILNAPPVIDFIPFLQPTSPPSGDLLQPPTETESIPGLNWTAGKLVTEQAEKQEHENGMQPARTVEARPPRPTPKINQHELIRDRFFQRNEPKPNRWR